SIPLLAVRDEGDEGIRLVGRRASPKRLQCVAKAGELRRPVPESVITRNQSHPTSIPSALGISGDLIVVAADSGYCARLWPSRRCHGDRGGRHSGRRTSLISAGDSSRGHAAVSGSL